MKAPEKAWLWEGLAVLGSVAGNLVLFQAARTGRKWTRKEEETHFHVVRAFTDPAAPGVVNVPLLGTSRLKSWTTSPIKGHSLSRRGGESESAIAAGGSPTPAPAWSRKNALVFRAPLPRCGKAKIAAAGPR